MESDIKDSSELDIAAFFAQLAHRGIRVLLDENGALRVKGKKEQLDSELVATLKANRSAIAQYLKQNKAAEPVVAPSVDSPDEKPQTALSLTQQKELLEDFNRTGLEHYRSDAFGELTLHGLVEAQVVDNPNKIAVEFHDGRLSYAQLNQQANKMAVFLRREGINADDLVAICLAPGIELIKTMLAVLKSGGAYAVVSPDNPKPVADCQFDLVITNKHFQQQFTDAECSVYALDDIEIKQAIEVCASANPATLETQNALSLACTVFGKCPNGVERGVMIEHGNIITLVQKPNFIDIDNNDVVGFSADVLSDMAVFEIWSALANGATLIEINRNLQSSPAMLKQALLLKNVNILHAPMPLVSHLVSTRPDCFAGLEHLLITGNQPDIDIINKLTDGGKPKHLTYGFGVLENTVLSTTFEIKHRLTQLPLGKPVSASYCYILDEDKNLVPQGEVGTLYVGGFGLARGYLGNWHETEVRFLPSPFSDDPNDRIFATNIQAKYLPDGTIEKVKGQETTFESQAQSPLPIPRSSFKVANSKPAQSRFYQPVWQSQPLSTLKRTPLLPGGCFVIFADNYGIGNRLAQNLRLASQQVVTVKAGLKFAVTQGQEYAVNPTRSEDYLCLFESLSESGLERINVIHLWSIAAMDNLAPCEPVFEQMARFESQLSKGLRSAQNIIDGIAQSNITLAEMNLVTRQCYSVTSDENLVPSAATIGALVDKSNQIWQIDLGFEQLPPNSDMMTRFADFINAELGVDKRGSLVAYRGKQRWRVNYGNCSPHEANGTVLSHDGNFMLVGVDGALLGALTSQLKAWSPGAGIYVLSSQDVIGNDEIIAEHFKNTDKVFFYPVDFSEQTQFSEIVAKAWLDAGLLNGVVMTTSHHMPSSAQVQTLLSLDEHIQANPSEFSIVLSLPVENVDGAMARLYAQGFIQNKHNRGCERWLHVQLDGEHPQQHFDFSQLMQLARIPNLQWRLS